MVAIASSNKNTIKFLYSYGGRILPRSTDGKLRYVGGHTRLLSVPRAISFSELLVKFVESCGSSVTLKCRLPTEDLDTLVSVTSDDDLANLIEEYDRSADAASSIFPIQMRAVLFPPKSLKVVSPPPSSPSSVGSHKIEKPPPPPYLCGSRRSATPVGVPVARGGGKAAYHPCCVQGNPSPLYAAPYWNGRRCF